MQRARPGATDVLRPMILFLLVTGGVACAAPSPVVPTAPATTLGTPVPPSSTFAVSPSGGLTASPARPSSPASPSGVPPTESASPNTTPSSSPGGQGAAAAGCSGSSQTKDFFTAIAEAVDWPVYCAALPAGWSVDRGSGNTYSLANGGRMVIGYHTNAGLHLELREGRWCTESAAACSAHDEDLGPISLGELQGELMSLGSGGGYVVYVDPGLVPSWTITGSGMDEAAFRSLIAAVALVYA